jgi:hypothetical protein
LTNCVVTLELFWPSIWAAETRRAVDANQAAHLAIRAIDIFDRRSIGSLQ